MKKVYTLAVGCCRVVDQGVRSVFLRITEDYWYCQYLPERGHLFQGALIISATSFHTNFVCNYQNCCACMTSILAHLLPKTAPQTTVHRALCARAKRYILDNANKSGAHYRIQVVSGCAWRHNTMPEQVPWCNYSRGHNRGITCVFALRHAPA